jgi:hypothetical protein
MKLIAKAALGALAITSLGVGISAPADAARVVVTRPGIVMTRPGAVVTHRGFIRRGRVAIVTRPTFVHRPMMRRTVILR